MGEGHHSQLRIGGVMIRIVALLVLILDIIALADILKSSMDTANKALWILLILILPVIGMALYFLIGKKA
jgi:hypothetical protein